MCPPVLYMNSSMSMRALLQGLIDYAGLFPPAALDMGAAVRNYAAYHAGPDAWALGRFVVPVARLGEFENQAPANLSNPWELSVLAGPEIERDLQAIVAFNERHAGGLAIRSVELKASQPATIAVAARIIPILLDAYFEIPITEALEEMVAVIGDSVRRAKLRTGGATASAFPSSTEAVRFISACNRYNVPFKATAGLHHPIRCAHPLTADDPEAGPVPMHGFLNLFLAAAWIRNRMSETEAVALLEERDAGSFQFDAGGAHWRSYRLLTDQIVDERRNFASSFGSCSFEEPLADLRTLGLLPLRATA